MINNLTDRFINGLEEKAAQPVSGATVRQVKLCVADYIACAFLGESMVDGKLKAYLSGFSAEAGVSSVIGVGVRVSAQNAALLNGISAHVAELDDGHRYAMLHPGAPVVSALLAIAPIAGLTGEQFIKGVVMGYEATIRLASAIQPGHKLLGWHATGTCGTVGAAAGIAFALGFDTAQLKAAVSAAATSASGLLEMIDNTSTLKPYNIGRAAAAAVSAAFVGRSGFCGPVDALGGKRGLFAATAEEPVQEEYLCCGFGNKFAVDLIYRKVYAACRHCHPAIEAAMLAAADNGIATDEIQRVNVLTYSLAVAGHEHQSVSGSANAKMSTPYSVAAALVCGSAGYQQFEEPCLSDERILSLAERVSVAEDPQLSAMVPKMRCASVELITARGSFSCRVDYPKGEPENPVTQSELEEKARSLMAAAGKSREDADKLLEYVMTLESALDRLLGAL